MRAATLAMVTFASMLATAASAGVAVAAPTVTVVVADRAVARFNDPEAGGNTAAQRFVMMRELVLEAWLIAYERTPSGTPSIDEKSLRLALDRHVIETVLGTRALPAVYEARIDKQLADARLAAAVGAGGEVRFQGLLNQALGRAESAATDPAELTTILRRRARAELYLEAAVGLAYEPSEADVATFYGAQAGKLFTRWRWDPKATAKEKPEPADLLSFESAAPKVRAHLRTTRLREGAQTYHQAVRSKLRLENVSEN